MAMGRSIERIATAGAVVATEASPRVMARRAGEGRGAILRAFIAPLLIIRPRIIRPLIVLALALLATSTDRSSLSAQPLFDPSVHFSIPTSIAGESTAVLLDHSIPIDAWNFGLCHDPTELALLTASEGAGLLSIGGGQGPAFHALTVLPGGVTSSMVVDPAGSVALPPGKGREVLVLEYAPLTTDRTSTVAWCDTLALPPLPITVQSGSQTITPLREDGVVITDPSAPLFILEMELGFGEFDAMAGFSGVRLDLTLTDWFGNAPPVYGVRFGVGRPSIVEEILFAPTPQTLALGTPTDPIAFEATVLPSQNAVTLDLGFSTSGTVSIVAPMRTPLCTLEYTLTAASLLGTTTPFGVPIPFDGTAGVVNPIGIEIDLGPGLPAAVPITIASRGIFLPASSFRRGDCNGSGQVDLADAVAVVSSLFGAMVPTCDRACDSNDDGAKDIADAIWVLQFLFGQGALPPSPGPFGCGVDPTAQPNSPAPLDCASASGC